MKCRLPRFRLFLALLAMPLAASCSSAAATGLVLGATAARYAPSGGIDTQTVGLEEPCTSLKQDLAVRVDSVHRGADSDGEPKDLKAAVSFLNVGSQTTHYPSSFLTWFYAVDRNGYRIQTRIRSASVGQDPGETRLEPEEAATNTIAFPVGDRSIVELIFTAPTAEPGKGDFCRFRLSRPH